MDTQNYIPQWMEALEVWVSHMRKKWYRLSNGALANEIDCEENSEAKKEFVSSMDWDICKYCLGPCGNCEKKQTEYPNCDPCRQDIFGYTECDDCPILMLKEVHQMLVKEMNIDTD